MKNGTTNIWGAPPPFLTRCRDVQWQRPNRKRWCQHWIASFLARCSAQTVTCPWRWWEMKCVNRFWCERNCSNETVWCANTTRSVAAGSKNVSLIVACTCTSYSNTIRFRPVLQSDKFFKFYWFGTKKNGGVNLCTSVKLDRQSAMLHAGRRSSSFSL